MNSVPPTPQDVADFWSFARQYVGWATLEPIVGQQQLSTIEPAWMHLADDAQEANALLKKLVEDGQLEMVSELKGEESLEDLPAKGDLVIVVDGGGRPSALASTRAVQISAVEQEVGANPGGTATLVKGGQMTEMLNCLYPPQGDK